MTDAMWQALNERLARIESAIAELKAVARQPKTEYGTQSLDCKFKDFSNLPGGVTWE